MINDPINQELTKYKVTDSSIPWEEEYYKYFLKLLAVYIQLPTNNRKIAQEMGKIMDDKGMIKTNRKKKSLGRRNE